MTLESKTLYGTITCTISCEFRRSKKKEKFVPLKGNYQQKYEHLIGKDSALEAAKKTELNKNYGMVSAESKRDRRTVEDIQKEIREKKRQKLENDDNDS